MAYSTAKNNTKSVRYLDKDFNDFKNALINMAEVYYPDLLNDFTEGSPGTMFIEIFRRNIDFKRIKKFYAVFLFFFILSPSIYLGISIYDKTKRTDFPGKEIARLVQNKWNDNFINDIKIVIGDEWFAGNLSYHLASRPIWFNDLKNKISEIKDDQGVIYVGNSKILKKICPGVFGKIAPVGYCMIGKR